MPVMMQKTVAVSLELLKLRRKRNVLIRGAYDTFAERFAKEKKFDFPHCGISLAAMAVPSFCLNDAFPGSDYMFLKLDISFMPQNQYIRAGVYFVLITMIFHLLWLAWRMLLCARKKSLAEKRMSAAG